MRNDQTAMRRLAAIVAYLVFAAAGVAVAVAATGKKPPPPPPSTVTQTVVQTRTATRTLTAAAARPKTGGNNGGGSGTVTVERTTTVTQILRVPALRPGSARINLQAAVVATRQLTRYSRARVFNLYNKPAYRGRIGTAVEICSDAGGGWRACKTYLRLGRGTLVADALTPAAARFVTGAILGGTGLYSNAGGTITLQPIGPHTYIILATLESF